MKKAHSIIRNSSIRILILGNMAPYRIGGAEVQVRLLAEAFARRGHAVTVAGYANPNKIIRLSESNDVHFVSRCLPILWFNRLSRAVTYFTSLLRFILPRRNAFDIVMPVIFGEGALSVALLKNIGIINIPSVISTQCSGRSGDAALLKSLPLSNLWVRLINRGTNAVNYLSLAVEDELGQAGLQCPISDNIPNGTKVIADFHGTRQRFDGVRSFLFAGRLAEQKGLFDLLTAISIVSRQGYRFTVDIVGGGVLAKKLGEEVRRLSIEKHVNFHGQTPPEEMSLHYRTAHILILPSLYEGHPLVINEAMSHGMPVIVTRSGGPEYFVEQSMGTVCNPGKAHELADAMATMIRLPSEKLRAMGMAGKDKVGRCCDIDIVAGRYVELFVRAIKSAGR